MQPPTLQTLSVTWVRSQLSHPPVACAGHMRLGGGGRLAVPTGCKGRGSKRVRRSLLALSRATSGLSTLSSTLAVYAYGFGHQLNVYGDMKHSLLCRFLQG